MTQSITFRTTEKWRRSEIGGAGHLTRTETVYANGHVDVRVTGYSEDDGAINQRAKREHGPLDLEVVKAARLQNGWAVVE